MPLRLLFAGTPTVALPALRALLAGPHEVLAVLTRPDAAAGRGRRTRPSPVAELADEVGVEVLRPAGPRDPAFQRRLVDLAPDCVPVVAYGALVPEVALEVPSAGWVNLHFSLLPAWRGAAPVQHALLAGDEVTGATTFRLVRELDAGPVYGTTTEVIRPRDTAGDLLARLARSGADLLAGTLDGLAAGRVVAVPQPVEGVSYAPRLQVDDARVRWDAPAFAVDRRIRACTPAPGPWTTLAGERIKLGPVLPAASDEAAARAAADRLAPGALRVDRHAVLVGTSTDPVLLGEVQPQGKRPMPAADWARGARLPEDARLGG
ncbi:MAG: methionyl-tRNA formyltransferase [Nocardioidaceae bacterium]|nr:methionyl-tRNA formyltransferase [Nocardioidaceae bacterium]